MTKTTKKTTLLTLILTFFLAIVAIFSITPAKKSVKASAASTTISQLSISSMSKPAQIYVKVASNNVPTTVVNWIWTGEIVDGKKTLSEFGKDAISGAASIYGYQSNYFIVEPHVEPTEGTKIAIPGNKIFTVDGMDYVFDQNYTFTYSGSKWSVAGTPAVVEATVISDVLQGEWCASTSTANQLRLNAASLNVPTTVVNWNSQLGIAGVSSMYGGGNDWFAMDLSPAATAGTKITIPGNKEFTVAGKAYKFDQDYNFWYNGTGWQTTEYVTTTVISGVMQGEWCASTSSASQLRLNATSKNVPTTIVNWNKQLGITGVSSMYGAGDVTWFAMDISPAATAGTKITIPGNKIFTVDGQDYKFDQDYSFWYNGTGWQTTEYVVSVATVISGLTHSDWCASTSTASQIRVSVTSKNLPAKIENWNKQLGIAGVTSMYNGGDGKWLAMDLSPAATAGTKITIPGNKEFTVDGQAYKFDQDYSFWYNGTGWQTTEYVPATETFLTFKGIGATNAQNGVVIEFNETVPAEVGTVGNLSYASGTLGKNATWQESEDGAVNKFNAASSTGVLMSGNGIVMYPPSGLSKAGAKIVIPAGTTLIESATNIVAISETITLWFDGATWSTTEYVPVVINPMSLFDVRTADSIPNTLYVNATGIPVQVVNWIWGIPESATFRSSITLTGTDKAVAELSIYSENDGILIITGLNAVDGTYIKIPGGVPITVNGTKCQFDKDYEFTYAAGEWHVGKKNVVTQVIDGETIKVVAGAEYTLPSITTENGLVFGWKYGDKTYAVGDTITLSGNVSLEAEVIDFVQEDGAAIRLSSSANESGIRFTCFLSAEDFAKYKDIIVSIGIEVQPLDLMNPDHTVNEEKNPVKFSLSGEDLKVVSNVEFGEGVLLRGTIKKMYTHNYKRPIAARSYIEVLVNGETQKIYIEFDREQHVRTISEVAEAYKEDKQIVGNEVLNAYIGASDLLTYGYFSPVATKENYEAYKAAGFNTLWLDTFSDQYCYFEPFQTVEEALAAAKTFADAGNKYTTKKNMDLALEAGIKQVLVCDTRIRLLTQCDVPLVSNNATYPIGVFTEEGHKMGSQIVSSKLNLSANTYNGKAIADILYPFATREALKEYIAACLASYMDHEAFYGVFLVDEPKTEMFEQVGLVKQIIKEICPDAYTQCPQLPPTGTITAWENSLRAYLDACGGVGNVDEFSYDFYPYTNDTNWWESLWGNESFTIVPTYIQAMQVAANLANEYGCIWELAFQTYENEHYMELNEARVFWQTNLATAFGVDRLSAYTYAGTSADAPTQYIENDANLKAWVKTALAYAEHAREALAHYSYNASQTYTASEDFVKNVTKKAFSGNVFTSISSTDDLLVNEFVYEGGSKYAYAFVNCTNVIDGNTQITVTVNFAQATTLEFIYNGVTVQRTFAAGANTFTLNAGEMAIIK